MTKQVQTGNVIRTVHKKEKDLVPGVDYIEIKLTQGFTAKVSPEDIDLTLYDWHAHVDNKNGDCYAAYVDYSFGVRTRYWLHREVMEKVLGRNLRKGEIVDHINHDKLDCRRENLRLSDASRNQANIKKIHSGKKYKGVYKVSRKKNAKWKAVVIKDGKPHYLGTFDSEKEAAKAYNKKALELFGDYAYLNDIDDD